MVVVRTSVTVDESEQRRSEPDEGPDRRGFDFERLSGGMLDCCSCPNTGTDSGGQWASRLCGDA